MFSLTVSEAARGTALDYSAGDIGMSLGADMLFYSFRLPPTPPGQPDPVPYGTQLSQIRDGGWPVVSITWPVPFG